MMNSMPALDTAAARDTMDRPRERVYRVMSGSSTLTIRIGIDKDHVLDEYTCNYNNYVGRNARDMDGDTFWTELAQFIIMDIIPSMSHAYFSADLVEVATS